MTYDVDRHYLGASASGEGAVWSTAPANASSRRPVPGSVTSACEDAAVPVGCAEALVLLVPAGVTRADTRSACAAAINQRVWSSSDADGLRVGSAVSIASTAWRASSETTAHTWLGIQRISWEVMARLW
jgi:hypothetical protein